MRELLYLIKRIKKIEIAERLGIRSSNISLWLLTERIPRKHLDKIKKIKKEVANDYK